MTSAAEWASAIAAIASAIAATAGLFFVGVQISGARKTADANTLRDFLLDTEKHEHALFEASEQSAKEYRFVELVNFLEAYAAGLDGKLFPRITSKIVRSKLIESLVLIDEMPEWRRKFQEAVTSETTFEHLSAFARKERKAIGDERVLRAASHTRNAQLSQ